MLTPHLGTNLGIGKKNPVIFPHLLNNPGPGSYETINLNNFKQSLITEELNFLVPNIILLRKTSKLLWRDHPLGHMRIN